VRLSDEEEVLMPEPRPCLRLSRLLHELQAAGFQCEELPYRKLWQGAVERRFPAHQVNGVWHFYQDDVPAIGVAFGLLRGQSAHANTECARKVVF
jgi:hypothetical protein